MGQCCSRSLKVSARLMVTGKRGDVNHLTLSLPRRKGGRSHLASFVFPSAMGGPGHHCAAHSVVVPMRRLLRKDGATPVTVDFLKGEILVFRGELPLAELLEGVQDNTSGSLSSVFFSLEEDQAAQASGSPGAGSLGNLAAFFNNRRLDDPRLPRKDTQEDVPTSLTQPGQQTEDTLQPNEACETLATDAGHTAATQEPQHETINTQNSKTWNFPDTQNTQTWNFPLPPRASQAAEMLLTAGDDGVPYDLGDGLSGLPPPTPQLPQPYHMPSLNVHPPTPQLPQPYHLSSLKEERPDVSEASEAVATQGDEDTPCDQGDGLRGQPHNGQLRHRMVKAHVGEGEPVLSNGSVTPPPEQGKKVPRRRRTVREQYWSTFFAWAQTMVFIVVVHHVTVGWW